MSPGDGSPLLSASTNSSSSLLAASSGPASSDVTVASPAAPVAGSSLGVVGMLSPLRKAWLATWVTLDGSGFLTTTSKTTCALSPLVMSPRLICTAVSPMSLPESIVPLFVVTEPIFRLVTGPGLSTSVTPVTGALPMSVRLRV